MAYTIPSKVICVLVLLAAVFLSYFRIFDSYELETLDARFRLRGNIPVDKNIVIVEIGDDTIDKLGKWPISRKFHATLIDALTSAGAEAIIFDIFFSEESGDAEADRLLAKAIARSGKVYLPYVFDADLKEIQEDILDKFKIPAKGTGFINIIPDIDGKFRHVPPFIEYEGEPYPHLAVLAAGNWERIPRGPMLVNFPGPWVETFRHYSYIDVIEAYVSGTDLGPLKGAVCFVGLTATATPDAHPGPFDALYPGVGVHASVFNSILKNQFLDRASRLINIFMLLFLGLVTYFISTRARKVFGIVILFSFLALYALLAHVFFVWMGLWLDVFYPVAAMIFLYLGMTFSKYIIEARRNELLEKELEIARKIQRSFLPEEMPRVSGIDVSAEMSTARQVGGDLYDFVADAAGGRLGIMIGDVAGKGVPAALYMAKVVSEFKSYAGEENASQAITKLNERLCKEGSAGLFVTLSYIIFDVKSGVASFSSGGHLPMIVVKREITLVDVKEGIPLGLFESPFGEEKINFSKGDTFVLYTDGVTEAMNSKGEMFGQERLVELVKNNKSLTAEELTALIQHEVKKFEGKRKQHDDITVIVVRV